MIGIIASIIMIGSISPTGAQDAASWSVWVYDASSGHAVQVDDAGTIRNDLTLPVPDAYAPESYRYSLGMAVSDDGTRLAYRLRGLDTDGFALVTVMVYDALTGEVLLQYNPPIAPNADSFDIAPTVRLFSDNGGALAYAYATGDSAETQVWQMIVLDVFTGELTATLASSDEVIAVQDFGLQETPFLLPSIHNYSGTQVDFTLFPYETGLNLPTDSFQWNVISGRVVLAQRYPTITSDVLMNTGEAVLPTVDERVAYDDSYVPYLNALHVFRPDLGGRVPFFATTTVDIFDAFFVQNGERVALVGDSLLDFSQVWLLIDRDGASRVLTNIRAQNDVLTHTPDGFAYIIAGESPVLTHARTRTTDIEQTPLWIGRAGGDYSPVWSSPPTDANYGAWAQLAPPIFAAQTILGTDDGQGGGVTPDQVQQPQGNPSGVLTVQGVAIINTTGGDRLNMRASPALTGEIIARVESGARVVIVDGPRASDGFVWWQVRLTTGLTGWVVERADDVDTLIPAG